LGFPEVAFERDYRREELLRTYFNDILAKDVVVRYNIRHYGLVRVTSKNTRIKHYETYIAKEKS